MTSKWGITAGWPHWAYATISLLLAFVHLYLGTVTRTIPHEPTNQFVFIGVVFLVWTVVYLSPFWRLGFYIIGAGFAVFLGVIWWLGGMQHFRIGILTGALATGFIILSLYLFVTGSTNPTSAS